MTALTVLPAMCLLTATTQRSPPRPDLPSGLDLSVIRELPVQYEGRYPPLDTVALRVVETVTGTRHYRGYDPVALLLAWTFQRQAWLDQPLIRIGTRQVREAIGLDASKHRFSYIRLRTHPRLREMLSKLQRRPKGQKPNPLESKLTDIDQQLVLLERAFAEDIILAVPHPTDAGARWSALDQGSAAQEVMPSTDRARRTAQPDDAQNAWARLRRAFREDDPAGFLEASRVLLAALRKLPAAYYPHPSLIDVELRYNRIRPFRLGWIIMLAAAGLSLSAMMIRRVWCDAAALLALLAGFATVTYGLALRWRIAERIPAANMYESLLFLAWGMGAFGLVSVVFLRHRIVLLNAAGMGALALILADCLPIDPYVGPIPPVLRDTIWMSIHVPIIMVSYSVLAMAVLLAHAQLVVLTASPRQTAAVQRIDAMQYWYILVGSILLSAGIITGSIWGASSWGRYWGWDPKEVWSLIAFMGYMAILHGRADRWLGRFGTAACNILAFWLIVMTYVGVNYVLGIGLHSYAFGTGAVARWLLSIGLVELVLLLFALTVHLSRARLWRPAAGSL